MPTLLVTGGAGFIGSHFVRAVLAASDDRVIVLDKLTYSGSLLNLDGALDDPRLTFVEGDIADRETVRDLFARHRPGAVVHLAAETHVDRSLDDPAPFLRTNVLGTFELLEAARRHLAAHPAAAAGFRFVHVSTDEVFGSVEPQERFRETSPYDPSSPYAASKAASDHVVRAYGRSYGLPVLVGHASNNYGPYQFPEKLVPLMTLNALEGRPLPLYGDGRNVRDWLFVEDHCRALLLLLESGRPGESYCFGGGAERTNREVVEAICDLLDRRLGRGPVPRRRLIQAVPDRPGHDRRYALDGSKAQADLGWRPQVGFAEGLERTAAWYLQHRDWCEAVQADRYRRERLGAPAVLPGPGR